MARSTQCTLRAIRFYEQQGLLSVGNRTTGQHRRYSSEEFERLQAILDLRRAGLSLEEIRGIVEIQRRHATGAAAARDLRPQLRERLATIDERITQLQLVRGRLQELQNALSTCEECHADDTFPEGCRHCRRISNHTTDNPIIRALWTHSQ